MPAPPSAHAFTQLVIVESNLRQETPHQIVEKVAAEVAGRPLRAVATFLKDKEDGDLTSTALDAMKKLAGNLTDFKDHFDRCNLTKTESELRNLQTAADFTEWSFARLVNEVEEMIEGDTQVKHSAL